MSHSKPVRSSTTQPDMPFSLTLKRSLLRQICQRHVTCGSSQTALNAALEGGNDVEDDFPLMAQCQISTPSVVQTLAGRLTPEEISKLLEENIDPFSDAHDGSTIPPYTRLPFSTLIAAVRFADLLTDPERIITLVKPLSFTLLKTLRSEDRALFGDELQDILDHLRNVSPVEENGWGRIKTAALTTPNNSNTKVERQLAEFHDQITEWIAEGRSIIALAPSIDCLPAAAHVICAQSSFSIPLLTRDMVVEILRQTHSLTGQLSETAIHGRLPSDSELQALSLPLIKNAFHATTTLTVADRLRELCETAKTIPANGIGLTLEDIHLPKAASDDMEQVLSDLVLWRSGQLDWSEVSSSALFFGPPGNGKTRLASALAGSAGIPLITTSYADCQKAGHQGDFLRVLADAVEEAIGKAPCVLFIDELDSFSNRAHKQRSSDYVTGVVNGLLEHLTRLNDTAGVIILGATNNPQQIDPAVIRPGRFDLKIPLGNPDRLGITRILQIELGRNETTLDLGIAADRLMGSSGAQIAAVVRDARGKARHGGTGLTKHHLEAAIERVATACSTIDLNRIAIHEAGHAVVAHVLGLPLPEMVQVTTNGGEYIGTGDAPSTKSSAEDCIAVTLAGRAAEDICLGDVSNGANSDLAHATELAFKIRHQWGLKPDNLLSLHPKRQRDLDSYGQFGTLINRDLLAQYDRAKTIVLDNQALVERVAEALLKHRELDGQDLMKLLEPQTNADNRDTKLRPVKVVLSG